MLPYEEDEIATNDGIQDLWHECPGVNILNVLDQVKAEGYCKASHQGVNRVPQ